MAPAKADPAERSGSKVTSVRAGVSDLPAHVASERDTVVRLRRFLLFVVLGGVVGMGLELLFIGHFEDPLQRVPVVLLSAGLIALAWQAWRPGRASTRIVQLLMALFVASGTVGVVLHYRGNAEFEREMDPSIAGVALVRETLTGATPVLAPGSMALLGVVGLTAVYGISPGRSSRSDINEENAS